MAEESFVEDEALECSPISSALSPSALPLSPDGVVSDSPQKTTRESFMSWMRQDQAVWRDLHRFAEHIGTSVGKVDVNSPLGADKAAADFKSAAVWCRSSSAPPGRNRSRGNESRYRRRKPREQTRTDAERARSLKYLVAIDPAMNKIKNNLRNAAFYMFRFDWDRLFNHYDRDNSGTIQFEEFRQLIRRDGKICHKTLSDDMLREIYMLVDEGGDGTIEITELIEWLESAGSNLWEEAHLDSYSPIPSRRVRSTIRVRRRRVKVESKDDVIRKMGMELDFLKTQLQGAVMSPKEELAVTSANEVSQADVSEQQPARSESAKRGYALGSVEPAKATQFNTPLHFGIMVSRVHGESLGLHLSATMVVDCVKWSGQVGSWNVRHPEKMVQPGDKIVEVNGKRGSRAIIRELQRQQPLQIFLARTFARPSAKANLQPASLGVPGIAFIERDIAGSAALDETQENVSERRIPVEINRCRGEDLGIDLTWPHLEVVAVSWQGLIGQWNAKVEHQHPVMTIRPGDRIIEANNHYHVESMVNECKRKAMLQLVFSRKTRKGTPRTQRSAHILEERHLNPLWQTIKRNLIAHAYNFGGIDWSKLFHQGDSYDNDKLIHHMNFEMFSQLVRKQGKMTMKALSEKKLQEVFASLDEHGSGEVELSGFTKWMGIELENTEETDDSEDDSRSASPGRASSPKDKAVQRIINTLRASMYNAGSGNWLKMFNQYDRDKNGSVSFPEFRQLMRMDFHVQELNAPDDILKHIFSLIDADRSGEIDYNEMVNWLIGAPDEEDARLLAEQVLLEDEDEQLSLVDAPAPARVAVKRADDSLRISASLLANTPENAIGRLLTLAGQSGTVRFMGETQFAAGIWVGVELDKPLGKNNGAVGGVEYFTCEHGRGIFVREEVVADLLREDEPRFRDDPLDAECVRCACQGTEQERLLTNDADGQQYCLSCWSEHCTALQGRR